MRSGGLQGEEGLEEHLIDFGGAPVVWSERARGEEWTGPRATRELGRFEGMKIGVRAVIMNK